MEIEVTSVKMKDGIAIAYNTIGEGGLTNSYSMASEETAPPEFYLTCDALRAWFVAELKEDQPKTALDAIAVTRKDGVMHVKASLSIWLPNHLDPKIVKSPSIRVSEGTDLETMLCDLESECTRFAVDGERAQMRIKEGGK